MIEKIANGLKRRIARYNFENEKARLTKISRFIPGTSDLFGVPFHYVDAATFVGGYEEIIRDRIYEFRPGVKDPLIIDCGANIGLSVFFFKRYYPKSRIIAFEPDPNIFKVLETNVKELNLSNVELHQKAIWTENGSLSFQIEGGFSGRIPKEGDVANIISVPSIRLNDLLEQKVDFLKIDIEGAEYEVLNDIQHKLKNVENIFIEYHSHISEPQKLAAILDFLKNAGFRYHIQEAFVRKRPFVQTQTMLGMDLQLNVFGVKCVSK
jgi:FkbM family methyltransferase